MPDKVIDVPGFGPTAFPDSMSDDDIVQAIQKQHPDLAPKAASPAPVKPQTAADQLRGLGRFVMNDPMIKGPVEGVIGAAKDLGSTAYEIFKRTQRQNPTTPALIRMPEEKPDWLKPKGGLQEAGAAISTAAQFMAPSAAAGKIPAIAKTGLLARSIIEGAIGGGVSRLRGDQAPTVFKGALLTGGMTGLFGMTGKILGPLGKRIELSLLKPLKADLADVKGPPELAPQTMIQNLYKYNLGGTLAQSYEKAQVLTKDLGTRLRAALGANPKAEVDMLDVLTQTAQELKADQASNFGTNSNIHKALDKMLDEIQSVSGSGKVNLADAQDMKQALGYMGAWQNGLRDADSTATETVANAMYSKLRAAIENTSGQPDAIKAINQQFSEVIPIKNALIRRIPVAARRDPISLKEFLALTTGNLKGVGLAGADRILRSGTAADLLVRAGKNPIQSAGRLAPLVPTVTDRLRSRMNPNP